MDNLPQEIQNKIFYYHAEHPTSRIIKQEIGNLFAAYKNRYYRYFTVNAILFETFQQFSSDYYFSKPSIQFGYTSRFNSFCCNCSCCKKVYL